MTHDRKEESLGIVVAFLDEALADLSAGSLRPLAEYQARYPGFEAAIAEEYARLQVGGDTAATEISPRLRDPVMAFEGAWIVDRAAGRVRPLSEYLRLFPGADDAIASRHAELSLDEPSPSDSTWSSEEIRAPERLGHYRLDGLLGRGGQGVVYRAHDERLGREVALKVLQVHAGLSPEAVERFNREARIAARLDDPDICSVYEAGVLDGQAFIAMRLVEGRSLAELIAETRQDPQRGPAITLAPTAGTGSGKHVSVAAWFARVARAVHRAHRDGVIHRDLKPGNLVVTEAGSPVVLDFGLAAVDAPEFATLTLTGDVQGTLPYMSPEQVAGASDIDLRTDVYALGATLYEALAGERPFGGATREALSRAIETEEPVPLRRRNPAVSRDLETIVHTALAKERQRRYASAGELAEDLQRYCDGRPIAARPVGWIGRSLRWARRRPAVAGLIVLLAVAVPAVTGLGGYLMANLPAIDEKRERDARAEVDEVLARAYFELGEGDIDQAEVDFARALALDPQRDESLAGAVLTRLVRNDVSAAREILGGMKGEETAARRLIRQTVEERERGKEISGDLGDEVLATPSDHFVAGSLAVTAGHPNEDKALFARAFRHLSQAVLTADEPVTFWYHELAHAAGHLADVRLAEPVASALITRWPDSGWSWFWAGFAWCEVDAERSVGYMNEALKRDAELWQAWEHLADQASRRRDFREAAEHYRRALSLKPDRGELLCGLGQVLVRMRKFKEGLDFLGRAIEAPRPEPLALYERAGVYGMMGRLREAEEDARRYVELVPESAQGRVNLGLIFARQNRWEEALTAMQQAVEIDPKDGHAWRRLAMTQLRMGEEAAALASYEKVAEFAPDEAHYHSERGSALGRAGRDEAARDAFTRSVELDDSSSKAWFGKGIAHRSLGEQEEAVEAFEKVVKLKRRHAHAWCELGRALVRLERFDEAVAALERGHELGSRKGASWTLPSAEWLAEARRRAARQ